MFLTDEILFDYQRCQRRSFLNLHADSNLLAPKSDWVLQIQSDSQSYRNQVLTSFLPQEPIYPRGDVMAAAKATWEMMQQGVELIANGVLLVEGNADLPPGLPENATLVSHPDLLVKQPGASGFGDWLYMPVDIKFSKRPKRVYQIIAAFHAWILQRLQGVLAPAELILRSKGSYVVDVGAFLPPMKQLLADCAGMLLSGEEPEVFISRHPCDMCRWFNSCYAAAKETQHLSLLPGVTPSRYQILQQLQLHQVATLAAADATELSGHLLDNCHGNSVESDRVAYALILQAQAVLHNHPLPLPDSGDFAAEPWGTHNVELYFDIEAEPDRDLTFLHGVLVVDRLAHTETFYPFLAEKPEDEQTTWEQFLDLVWTYPQAPIFHFCDSEVQTVKKLARRYATPHHHWHPLTHRFIDIHKWVTKTAVLPVESYSLKALARWLGFQWREENANGAQCIVWYKQWLQNPDRTYLNAILNYNEDDCRATYLLKNWLDGFLAGNS